MKRMFKLIFLICVFVIKQEIYSSTTPIVPVGSMVATSLENNRINDKFKELYKDKNDFVELDNILSIEEKENMNDINDLENREKAYNELREKYSNEILLEKERLAKEYEKVIKEEQILKNGNFSEKIDVLFFGDLKYYTYGAIFLILLFIINKINIRCLYFERIRKEKSEIMKKFFIIFITIIGFISIENVVYANPSTTILNANTVIMLSNAERDKERRIEEKFTELYQDKEDFAELYNILTIDEKEILIENYSLENYEKAREFFKKEIPIERENIKNRNIKKAKDIEEFAKAGFFRKIELIVFEDVLGGIGLILVVLFLSGLALFLGMLIAIIHWICNRE